MKERSRKEASLKSFGMAVKRRRLSLGLTQEDLAEKSGLHRTYISSLENGQRNIALSNIIRLAKALDISPHELIKKALE
jgi:transcriptional regulator with XRE-family HTH domain